MADSKRKSSPKKSLRVAGEASTENELARREASGALRHRLRGAAFESDFDDADRDSSAVRNRRDDKVSDS